MYVKTSGAPECQKQTLPLPPLSTVSARQKNRKNSTNFKEQEFGQDASSLRYRGGAQGSTWEEKAWHSFFYVGPSEKESDDREKGGGTSYSGVIFLFLLFSKMDAQLPIRNIFLSSIPKIGKFCRAPVNQMNSQICLRPCAKLKSNISK